MNLIILGASLLDKDYIHKQLFDYFDLTEQWIPNMEIDCDIDRIVQLRLNIKADINTENNRIMAAHELILTENLWLTPHADFWFYLPTSTKIDKEYSSVVPGLTHNADVVDLPSDRDKAADLIRERVEGSQ